MIYVDALIDWGVKFGRAGPEWCHMTADTLEELHAFAERLGLKKAWFQDHKRHPHYDLTRNKRAMAVRFGAKEETTDEYIKRTMYAK